MLKPAFIACLLVWSVPAAAQSPHAGHPHQPYQGLEQRSIKALSAQQTDDLSAGRGMALALAAELNGYPGPLHVLEHADALALTPAQRQQTDHLYAAMQAEAKTLGAAVIGAETHLDRMFSSGHATPEMLDRLTGTAAAALGQLRAAHLRYHLLTRDLLTGEQVTAYQRLRGYQTQR